MDAKELSKPESPAFQLSLRIRHPSMDPRQIARQLGVEAEHSFRAGDPRSSSSRNPLTAVHSESYWIGLLPPLGTFTNIAFPEDPSLETILQRQISTSLKHSSPPNWTPPVSPA
jgi:hypothetical protein